MATDNTNGLPIEIVDFLKQLKDKIDNKLTIELTDKFDEAIDATMEEGKLKYDLFRNALVDMDIALREYTAAFNHLKEVCGVKGYLQ